MATSQAFCLRRNNHLSDMVDDLNELFKDEAMVDVTLSCEDGLIKAHRLILSVCSSYFKQIFSRVNHSPLQYPIIIIRDMPFQDLKYIVEFMYHGEVTIPHEHLNSVLRSAEALKVKGLADVNGQKSNRPTGGSSDEHTAGRRKKRRKRKRKTTASNSLNSVEKNHKGEHSKHANSSEEASEYSDEDDLPPHHHHQNAQSHLISDPQNLLHSVSASTAHAGPAINETEIEPSRLLEQTMITGDAQNIANIQSLSAQANQSKSYPQYLISSVKQMMYDDSSGLIASQLANDVASNHNLALSQFDESSSLVGPSSISLLPRQGEEHSFNSTATTNLSSAAQLMPNDGTSTSANLQSAGCLNSGLNSAANLLPMQIHPSLSTLSAASLPAVAGNLRPSSLSFSFESLSTKRHYSCPVCFKTFSEKGNMKRHTAIHEQIRPRYICDSCGKCFVWKDNHARHIRISHPNVPS